MSQNPAARLNLPELILFTPITVLYTRAHSIWSYMMEAALKIWRSNGIEKQKRGIKA